MIGKLPKGSFNVLALVAPLSKPIDAALCKFCSVVDIGCYTSQTNKPLANLT